MKRFLLFLVLLAGTGADFDLNILPSGSSHSRSLNTSVLFSCEAEATDETEDIQVKWIGPDNVDITERPVNSVLNERKYVENDNGHVKKLYIKHIELGDAGNYTCVASAEGREQRKSINFIVYKEIEFVSAESPQYKAIHTDATVVCKVDGLPKPEVSWRFKDRKLDSGRYEKTSDGLLIRNITMEDRGIYQCSANVENDGRFDFKTIKVEVHVPPTMSEGPGTVEGVEDEEAKLSCKGDGYPAPHYRFLKDGKAVEQSERIIVNEKTGELIFKPLKEEDIGTYDCVAYNDVGEVTDSGDLNVLVKPQILEFSNKTQNENQPVSLECKARGLPLPTFKFTKDGKEEPFQPGDNLEDDSNPKDDDRISVISNGEGVMRLTIKRVLPSDAGVYKCEVTNEVGKGEAISHLNVTYKPKFDPEHPKEFYIWAEKTRNISCEVDAHPPAAFEWSRNGDLVLENSTYKIFQTESKSYLQITVKEVDQYWIYGMLVCKADNGYGSNEIEIDLKRATIPDIPKLVEVKQNLPDGFILHVMPPDDDGGEPLTGYQVEYVEKNASEIEATLHNDTADDETGDEDDDEEDEDADTNPEYLHNVATVEQIDERELKIQNLRPSTNYVLRVRAKNEVGPGDFVAVEARTEDIRKPYPIKISSKSVGDANVYNLEWEKPDTGGAAIEEYEFKYRMKNIVDGKEIFSDWVTLYRKNDQDQPLENFHLKGLEPNSTYQLQVRAKNKIDWSDYSPVMEFQTIEAAESERAMQLQSAMSGGTLVGLILFVLFLLLVIIDLLCYVGCRRGVTHTLVSRSRERSRTGEKEKVMEEGEKDLLKASDDDDIKKPPIIEETIEDELEPKKEVA